MPWKSTEDTFGLINLIIAVIPSIHALLQLNHKRHTICIAQSTCSMAVTHMRLKFRYR